MFKISSSSNCRLGNFYMFPNATIWNATLITINHFCNSFNPFQNSTDHITD